jgi:hypothetical protein
MLILKDQNAPQQDQISALRRKFWLLLRVMSRNAYLIDILRVCSLKTRLDFLLPWNRGEETVKGVSEEQRPGDVN